MAKFYTFKTIDLGSVAANASVEKSWPSDDNYIIHKIFLVEKTGASLKKFVVTIWIDSVSLMKENTSAYLFDATLPNMPVLDVELTVDRVFRIAATNQEAASRDVYCILELWK
ncbi:MAG: hypothetical protein QXI11_01965 [Thermoproteota archaeon]